MMKLPTPAFMDRMRYSGLLPLALTLALSPMAVASLSMRTDSQAEGAVGWVTPGNFTPEQAINLTLFDDWLVAAGSGSVPMIDSRKAGGSILELVEIDEGVQSGANRVDPWHVYFDWMDGDPFPLAEGHHGVSWVLANSEPYAFMRFRADVGARSGQIFHFWNHNVQGLPFQRLTVTLHDAQGGTRAQEEFINDVFTAYYTSIITFSGQAEGDYIEILNIGQNVGWRGTALIFGEDPAPPPPLELPAFFDGSEATLNLSAGWAWDDTLGFFHFGAWPWVYLGAAAHWAYILGENHAAYYFFNEATGWHFTSEEARPLVYSFDLQSWISLP